MYYIIFSDNAFGNGRAAQT